MSTEHPVTEDTAADDDLVGSVERSLKPYRSRFPVHRRLPEHGIAREEILAQMRAMAEAERDRWAEGFASGTVYHGDPDHIAFLNEAYAINSQANPLHADMWPSVIKYEAEIVAMTAAMLGDVPGVCGAVSSGGTDSILLAMKTHRDRAAALRGVTRPRLVIPTTAHAAFEKAAQYFAMELVRVPVGPDGRADVAATAEAIDDQTVCVVGSAPCFPNGLVDPIEELAALAASRGVAFHTDACLGGFVLPWAEQLGRKVPPFDFRVPGVTSMSADTHKYGYAAKGTSVVLFRDRDVRSHMYYVTADWPGGLYYSPTFAGSRPGALSAACWAAMVSIGRDGYLEATRRILETADAIKDGIAGIDGVEVIGDPLFDIAVRPTEEGLDIYQVLERMGKRHWSLNGLQDPASFHLCVTLRHTQPGVAERFLEDLAAAVEEVRANPDPNQGLVPVYGMAAVPEMRGAVTDILGAYIDLLYEP